jgi:uncharacterized protein (UPF0333 family)
MKNNLRIMFMPVALVVIFGGAAMSFAQSAVVTGGYSPTSISSNETAAAAKYAVKAQGKKERATIKLIAVKQSEMQVVAGLNYRLCMEVSITKKGSKTAVTKNVSAVVYKNLKQKLSLTSWEEAVCLQLTLDDRLVPAKTP